MMYMHDTRSWAKHFEESEKKWGGLIPFFVFYVNDHKVLLNKICEHVLPQGRILEVGFGTCFASIWLSHLGYDVVAIDKDENIIKIGMKNNSKLYGNVKILKGDMFHLPFHEKSFDAIFHWGLLEHYDEPDIQRAINEHLRVAKKVVFAVPSDKSAGNASLYGDERLWSWKRWSELVRGCDAKILDVFGFGFGIFYNRMRQFMPQWFPEHARPDWKWLGMKYRHMWESWKRADHLLSKVDIRLATNIGFVIAKIDEE